MLTSYKKITSPDNLLIRKIKREVSKASLSVIENPKTIKDIISLKRFPKYILLTENKLNDYEKFFPSQLKERIIITSDKVIKYFSGVITHQGIIAFLEPIVKNFSINGINNKGVYVCLYEIQDPGNVGAIIRTAAALNLNGLIISPGCANPFSSKTIRASAGSCFIIDVFKALDFMDCLKEMQKVGLLLIAALQTAELIYYQISYDKPFVLILGNEGSGLPREIIKIANYKISIPMNKVESLNVACSSAIILYEAHRQKCTMMGKNI